MKKILITITAFALVLAFGTAFGKVFAAERTADWGLSNGVTVFIGNPEPTKIEGPEMALDNDVTVFLPELKSASSEEYGSGGSAAGGMAMEESHPLYNGVTVFDAKIGDSN